MVPSSNEIYRNLVPFYRNYSKEKQEYLDGVDAQIIPYIQDGISLLDLGTGDGVRILNLLKKSKKILKKVSLVDNCPEMLKCIKSNNLVSVEKKDFSSKDFFLDSKFDVITSLWNVLGHINSCMVIQSLMNMARHLKNDGIIIIDVNNRYNCKQYGINAIKNYFLDKISRIQTGDFSFEFCFNNTKISSFVHLFSQEEIESFFQKSGLIIQKKLYINYRT